MGNAVWWEQPDETNQFDLSAFRILVMIGDDFDYHETVNIVQRWRDWSAQVDIGGTDLELTGHVLARTDLGWDKSETKTLTADLLIGDVDISRYAAVFFPGGGSPDSLLADRVSRCAAWLQAQIRVARI